MIKQDNRLNGFFSLMVAGILIFIVAYGFILAYHASKPITDVLSDETVFDENNTIAQEGSVAVPRMMKGMDSIFAFFVIMLSLMIWISSIFIDTHPIFFVVTLIFFAIVIFIGGIFSDSFYQTFENETTSNPELMASAQEFQATMFIMNNLPVWLTVVGIGTAIIFYGKFRGFG